MPIYIYEYTFVTAHGERKSCFPSTDSVSKREYLHFIGLLEKLTRFGRFPKAQDGASRLTVSLRLT